MDIHAKLDQLSAKLLDTGKRNNLINFKDTLTSSAEVVFPDSESVFSKCTVGHVFRVFDPKIPEDEEDVANVLLEEELTAIIEEAAANDDDLALSAEIAAGAGFVMDAESTDTDAESTGTNAEGTAADAEGTTADAENAVADTGKNAVTAENANADTEKTAENPDSYSRFPIEQGTLPTGDSAKKSAAVKSASKKSNAAKSGSAKSDSQAPKKLTKKEFTELYSPKIKNDKTLLLYAQTANPLTAVKNIAKKAKDFLDETGINVAYLAFGFVRWNEKEVPDVFYRAPLLLVHVNIITKSVIDPIKIEISDDDVVLNPTFDYLLKAEYGVSLPPFEDGETLASYYSKVSEVIRRTKWEVLDECKLGIFSFLKINMYEDLKQNAEQILKNRNVMALLSGAAPNAGLPDSGLVIQDPLTELHTVVDADSSQLEAIEMAKSGKSFVLQGPPGTGKSQTITNIIAECLYDGKKVLFVSEKQAALNVVFDKLKKAGLADFCLELHSHKANKKAVLDELNRTLELPKSAVSSVAQEEIRQKKDAQERLDKYAEGLHQKRETIEKSLYQLIELYSSEREQPDLPFSFCIPDIQAKGEEYFHQALKLLDQYVEYVPSVGSNYKANPWYGFTGPRMSYSETNQFKTDLTQLLTGFKALRQTADQLSAQHGISSSSFSDTTWWQSMLAFLAESDVVAPSILSSKVLENVASSVQQMTVQGGRILSERNRLFREFHPEVLQELNGQDVHTTLTTQFQQTIQLVKQYAEYIPSVGPDSEIISWYDFMGPKMGYSEIEQFKVNLNQLLTGFKELQQSADQLKIQYGLSSPNLSETAWWQSVLAFLADSDVVTPAILSSKTFNKVAQCVQQMMEQSSTILSERDKICEEFHPEVLQELNGKDLYIKLTKRFRSFFSRLFNQEYKKLIAKIQSFMIDKTKLSYREAVDFAKQLKNLQDLTSSFEKNESAIREFMGSDFCGLRTDWKHIISSLKTLRDYLRCGATKLEPLSKKSNSEFVEKQKLFREDSKKLLEELKSVSESIERVNPLFNTRKLDFKNGSYAECIRLLQKFIVFCSHLQDYGNFIAGIQSFMINKARLSYKQAEDFAKQLKNLQALIRSFEENESTGRDSMGSGFCGLETDWAHITSSLDTLREYLRCGEKKLEPLAKLSKTEFVEKQEQFQQDAEKLAEEINAVSKAIERVTPLFNIQKLDLKNGNYPECIQTLQDSLENFAVLRNWISFMELLEQMEKAELLPFIDLMIDMQANVENIPGIYRKTYYQQWIEHILFSDPNLYPFTRIKQDQAVQIFKAKDNQSYEINKSQIKSELSRKRPNLDMVVGGSAVAILRYEGQKKRKQMPIRRLLSETGSLVQKIKPCFLMSPLSVSTFLDSEKISFDTIVFDEASQIFPQDAIGAIYRGAQLIVVGDSKQMPPSNFFTSTTDIETEDDFDNVNDFESILDVCSTVFDTKQLIWHYRSHYEQLIAFSNVNFYNNNLITFPSAKTDRKGIGVDYYYVEDGIFDRSKKTNLAEARFIVDLIYQHIEKYPNRSLGVVAFSVSQQNLIDQLLTQRRERDTSHEDFFSADRPEPFFIKNLETVQGDERDTIIFSVAYARDADNRFIHNFGPLNRKGGERRLNVAFTRAKDNVQLVSSIRYSDITSNSGSEGVRLLRAYLNYAQNGEVTLEKPVKEYEEDTSDAYFEQEVCDYLREQGFVVEPQVGCSEYKIDLGLKKPDEEDFLVAVECDGTTYHRFKNARDRDCLRQRVLENMGWKFYRIWSVDWYRNNPIEKEALLQMVQDAVQKSSEPEPEVPVVELSEMEEESAPEQNQFEIDIPEKTFPKYRQLYALGIVYKHMQDFQAAIREILETEAPLSEEFLLKRIVSFFDREKVTSVVIDKFNAEMRHCERKGIIRKNGFLYLEGVEKFDLRVPGDKRDIKYIAAEELAAGLYVLIKQNVTATKDKLCQSVMKLLGYSRMGNTIASRCDEALELLERYDIISKEDGVLSLKQEE